ncbi:hypothetical protein [Joostella sp. CR20]|uniref:hypothetical protein n=1 Tax=Joostella sp. CR20 TaxID=2804312 RepID=UPI00313CA1AB
MRNLLITLTIIALIIAIAFVILPLGTIAYIPSIIALILAFLLKFKFSDKSQQKLPSALAVLAVLLTITTLAKNNFTEEKVAEDTQYEERIEEAEEENLEELEEIQSELDELEIDEDVELLEEEIDSIQE